MGSLIAHPAFVIIDSIHFQYNGFLFGLLILSLFAAQKVARALIRLVLDELILFHPGTI